MNADNERFIEPVSAQELERRWQELKALAIRHDVEALVFHNHNDFLGGYIRWLTGVPATNAYPRSAIFFTDRPMVIVEQGAFGSHRAPRPDDVTLRGVADWFGTPSYSSATYSGEYDAAIIVRELQRHAVKRIGVVGSAGMYYTFARAVISAYEERDVVDITDAVDRLKAVKSAEEMAYVRKTAELQDEVMEAVKHFIQPGMRDVEVSAYAQYKAQQLGSEQGIFLAGSAPVSKAAVFKPRSMQGRTIQRGDCFTLLVEVNGPAGYYTEIARTFVLGAPSAALEDGLAHALEAQKHTLGLLKPGARCKDIFASHNDHMRARGLPVEERLHCHGQGYDMVERPLIRLDEDMEIAAGMNIVVHPGYVNEEVFAVICDNYLIGPDGPLPCLHRTPQELIRI